MIPTSLAAIAVEGFLLGAGLIVAIGAQNAFVLRQGLARQHVFPVALFCTLADTMLIAAGVAGLGTLVQAAPRLLTLITIAGAGFLLAYGILAARRALHPEGLSARGAAQTRLGPAIATLAALTLLNPHVYLDTVILLGSLSARYPRSGRIAFALGASTASALWFFGLAYGARLLAPLFARPLAWRALDLIIALVMATIAVSLLLSLSR